MSSRNKNIDMSRMPKIPKRRRKQRVTKETKDAIITAVANGMTFKDAAKLAGVSERWMKHERTINEEWREATDRAMEGFKLRHLANIAEHSQKTWTASAWLLERIFPENYNSKLAIDISANKELGAPNWFGKKMDAKELTEGEGFEVIDIDADEEKE